MGEYIRKTARYNGKKYEATGKTELEAMTKLAEIWKVKNRVLELLDHQLGPLLQQQHQMVQSIQCMIVIHH